MWDSIMPGEGRQASAIVIAGQGADTWSARRAAEAAGYAVRSDLSFSEASQWLSEGLATDAVLIELAGDDRSGAALLQAVDDFTTQRAIPLHVSGPVASIDMMAAHVQGQYATWLCNPELADRIAALAIERSPGDYRLHDIASDMDPQRLRRLADEVSRIARALSSLSATERPERGYAHAAMSDVQIGFRAEPVFDFDQTMPTPEEIRKILRLRRLRDQFFDPTLFADPAWDMLLDLMAARLERVQVAVSSLCIAAAVPPTTALRWIKAMTDHSMFERCADPDDGRRIFIQLSDAALRGMARYFGAMKKAGGLVI
jgi:DNA-binding MarR family transcriptional regulator